MQKIPLIIVCGPTASGKTALSIRLAKLYGCEIVSADSMQIYKGMNIATAKPTTEEMCGIKHHLIDFLEPNMPFSVADYVKLASECISDIVARGKLPLICGGTGLYISSLVDNIAFDDTCASPEFRNELLELAKQNGGEYLLNMLSQFDTEAAQKLHPNNLTRIIRAIEVYKFSGITFTQALENSKRESPYKPCFIGINFNDRNKLYERINLRVDLMLKQGLLQEAESVFLNKELSTSKQAIGYKELMPYFEGTDSLENCIEKLKMSTRHYAKRQLTWFRRDTRINWIYPDLCNKDEVEDMAVEIINNSGILNYGENNGQKN